MMAREINDAAWETEILRSPVPVLVDVYATHCLPCRLLAPVIDRLASEYEGGAKVVKLNTQAQHGGHRRLGGHGIPTILAFKDG